MRLLFLTSRLPFPPNRGDRVRTLQFLRQFSLEHEITLVSFVASEDERRLAAELSQYCQEIVTVLWQSWQSAVAAGLNIWRSSPLQVLYYRSAEMKRRVDDLLAKNEYDAVYVHLFRMAQYVAERRDLYRILDLSDMVSYEVNASLPYLSPLWRTIYSLEGPRIARYEQRIIDSFDEAWFISERDRGLIENKTFQGNLHVVPSGVDERLFSLDRSQEAQRSLIFIGNLDVRHNIDAAVFLAEEIMPLILQAEPTSVLTIAGAGRGRQVQELNRLAGVNVVGYVADLLPVFAVSAISIAPLRFSAGVQFKVIEAMAAGLPVVASSDVAAGLGAEPERELLVAEDALAFAQNVLLLMRNLELRRRLGLAARDFVARHYSLDMAMDRLQAVENEARGPVL